jgi:ArsR family transcriptional regulator, arsenate/arsenite/antimonite-responsive transcriptional repressor
MPSATPRREKKSSVPANTVAAVAHVGPRRNEQGMSEAHALSALAALGQPIRLSIFRMLVRQEPDGLPAGALAQQIGCAQNTLSTHLAMLARAGLIRGTRDGRSIIYRADVEGMRELIAFLVADCCDGHPDLCDFMPRKGAGSCSGRTSGDRRPTRRKR